MDMVLESKMNLNSFDELSFVDPNSVDVLIKALLRLRKKTSKKQLNAIKRFSEELASIDIENSFKSKEKGLYYCPIKKVWIARRMVNKVRHTIASGDYDSVYESYLVFCKKHKLKIS